jgi:transposase
MPPQRSFGTEISGNRRLHGELSIDARNGIISKSKAGASTAELAAEFLVTSKCVRDTLRRYSKTGSNTSRPRSGRPSILTPREIRTLYRHTRKTPKIQYKQLIEEAHLEKTYSTRTAYRVLKNEGLTNFRAKRRPKITRETAQQRLSFCHAYKNIDWRNTIIRFSDECLV